MSRASQQTNRRVADHRQDVCSIADVCLRSILAYGAEIVVATLDYQGADEEDVSQVEQVATEVSASQPVASAQEATTAKPKRSRRKKEQTAAA